MAKEGLKRRIEDNKKKLSVYLTAACVSMIIHVVIRFGIRFSSFGFWHVAGAAAGATALAGAYRALDRAAEPTYGPSPTFDLIDGGEDLGKSSPATAVPKDILWAAVLLLPVAAVSNWAWLPAAGVPVYALWGLFGKILGPLMGGGGAGAGTAEETDAQRMKRERAEKRSERRRIKRI